MIALLLLSVCSLGAEVVWSQGVGFRSMPVVPEGNGKAGFSLMDPARTGLLFTNTLHGDAYATNAVAHNGSGVAIGDVDGDGWQDIYLCNLQGPNRLYRNQGAWRFQEMDAGEAQCVGQVSSGAAFADVDGDGDLDLLVNGVAAGTRLFLNDGKGHFTEAKDSGLSRTASATSMALADIDGDGDLDLYCTHYIDVMHLVDPTTRFGLMKRDGKWVVSKVNDVPTTNPRLKDRFEATADGRVRELPEVHGFYRNDGHGHFTAIQSEPGIFMDEQGRPVGPFRDWGLAVMFRDLNGDGAPDIYVCNDNVSPDRIWINSGKGTFRAIDRMAFRHTSRSSMGIDFGDINRDGIDDIVVVDMLAREHKKRVTQLVRDMPEPQESELIDSRPQYNRNVLFFGRPDGTYAEAALMAGIAATDWTWSPILIDVDLDGYEDLLVTNGFEFDVMDKDSVDELKKPKQPMSREQLKRALSMHPLWRTENAAFRNRRDGTFQEMRGDWGFNHRGVSFGMALGDLDNDGDLDVVVNNLNEVASVYRNDATGGRVAVRLKGTAPNTQGTGARIRLTGPAVTQQQEMICGGRYVSCDQAVRVFAAETNSTGMALEVRWRSGKRTVVEHIASNRIYEIDETGASAADALKPGPVGATNLFFEDASGRLGHAHTEAAYDDWSRQPLLPRRLSRLGPGVAWLDLDGDGWEELIVTSGRGGKLAVFKNQDGKSFKPLEGPALASGDEVSVVGWPDGKGNRNGLVAVSNYEQKGDVESQIQIYSHKNLDAPKVLLAGKDAIGPLAVADIDGDGDIDLFGGGRFQPGHYPEPVSSMIWLNENGELKLSSLLSQPFDHIGLVSGATFADLDGDGQPDLALALEWGPIRVFQNDHGHFVEKTAEWGFAGRSGWWNSVVAGDFDGDGKLDLAVGNWGRNSIYELDKGPAGEPPKLRVFYGDWNGDGVPELIEAWERDGPWFPARNRTWLATGMPEIEGRFQTHEAFANATVREILGPRFESAKYLEASAFESGVFLNRGSHFEWRPFPMEAQLAPVFSINVADFDGDGIEDLFLAQNFFESGSDLTRDDAGRGLWLRGTGQGTFEAVDGAITGIKVYGEQRGAAVGDFDHDGRIDLAVSQNNGPTKLYLNKRAKPGLRVRLHGSAGNPDGISTRMRVLYEDGRVGPLRSVQGGSGYGSQDGTVQVLGCAGKPIAVLVTWPGGKEEKISVAENVLNIEVSFHK